MGGGTGRLPGRDVFYPDFKNCLYGRRDGTFFIPGLHENVSTRDDFTRETKNVPAKFFPYKRNVINIRDIHAWRDPGKRPVPPPI